MRMLLKKSIWMKFGQPRDERIAEDDTQVFLVCVAEMKTIKNTSLPRKYFLATP